MFGDIRRILGWIKLDFHGNYVHPLNAGRKSFRAPENGWGGGERSMTVTGKTFATA
jgi:hypothetical protein